MGKALTTDEIRFLEGVRDGDDVFPIVREIGYGWAVENKLVRHHGGADGRILDFSLTDAGRAALEGEP